MEGVADPPTSFSFRQNIGGYFSFFHCFLHIPDLFTIVFYILMLIAGSSCFMRLYAFIFTFPIYIGPVR